MINMEHPSLLHLHAILEDNLHLGTHVRELDLSIRRWDRYSPRPDSPPQIPETLLDILIRFTGITSCTWAEHQLSSHWWLPGEILRERLYQFLWLPSLVKVVISARADQVLANVLALCKQLKSLTVNVPSAYLEDSVMSSGAASISISTTCPTPTSGLLEELIIHQHCILELIHSLTSQSSRLYVSRLRKLILIRSHKSMEELNQAFQQVLDLCADSLEELTFRTGKHLLSPLPLSIAMLTSQMSADITSTESGTSDKMGYFDLTRLVC